MRSPQGSAAPSATPTPATRLRSAALHAAVLGGAAAVATEVVFTQRLSVLFGVTAPAVATVVAVYLLGMALGSILGGRYADRLAGRAGWLYAGAEGFSFLWALLFLPLAGFLENATAGVPTGWTVPAAALGTAVLVGPAAMASGATFPALARLVGDEGEVRRLVAANAAGAALGSVLAGFVLPPWLGLSGTLWGAGAVAAVAGSLVWWTSRGVQAPSTWKALPPPVDPLPVRQTTAIYALLGASGMVAEIGWTRLLEQTGPNPGALTFPLVLAAYLVGLAGGGLVLEPRLRRLGERPALATCALLSGLSAVLGVAVLPLIPPESLMGHAVGLAPGNVLVFELTGLQVSIDRLALYLLAAAVPGLASGAGLPIAASAITRAGMGLGRSVGSAWAAGTTAAVAASLWLGFLPSFGPGTVRILAGVGVVALVVAAWASRDRRLALVPVLGAGALLVPPWAGLQLQPQEELVAFVESAAGPSAVTLERGRAGPPGGVGGLPGPDGAGAPRHEPGPDGAGAPRHEPGPDGAGAPRQGPGPAIHWVYTHGERVGGFALDFAIPLVLHPDPAKVLLIAFGTGVNVPRVLADPAVKELVIVDIDQVLPSLAAHSPMVGPGLIDGTRGRFVNDDGRHLLRAGVADWDVVYSDVATYAQYVELGTVEFFALVRARLAPGGLFALKVHTDTLTLEGQERFFATFLEVFPDAVLFDAHGPMPILVGFTGAVDPRAFATRAAGARATYGDDVARHVAEMAALDGEGVRGLAKGRVSTDDRRMPLRVALVGPYGPGTYAESGQDAFFAAVDARGRTAAAVLFGHPGGVPRTSVRPTNPPVPPPRAGWW